MAKTAGVQCGGLRGDPGARPSLEMISDPRAISAAPVSSTQPIPAAESSLARGKRHEPCDRNVRATLLVIDKFACLPKSSLAQPFDSDGLPVEFEVDRMAILAAAADPYRRWEHGCNRRLGAVGDVHSWACHSWNGSILRNILYLTPTMMYRNLLRIWCSASKHCTYAPVVLNQVAKRHVGIAKMKFLPTMRSAPTRDGLTGFREAKPLQLRRTGAMTFIRHGWQSAQQAWAR